MLRQMYDCHVVMAELRMFEIVTLYVQMFGRQLIRIRRRIYRFSLSNSYPCLPLVVFLLLFAAVVWRVANRRQQNAFQSRPTSVRLLAMTLGASRRSTNDSFGKLLFERWRQQSVVECGGRITVYGGEFALLRDVVVDRRNAVARRRGGEPLREVANQSETDELYRLSAGFFRLRCDDEDGRPGTSVAFHSGSYLNDWRSATVLETGALPADSSMERRFIVALTRCEYANLYHTISDWYNVFLVARFFNVTGPVHVLLIDAHPAGPLDDVWPRLFDGGVSRLSDLHNGTTAISSLVWSIPGHRGPIEQHYWLRLPLAEKFRRFVLGRYDIDWTRHTLNCSAVSVLIVWRRDYVTHARNTAGLVRRKIANERQLERGLRRRNRRLSVRGVQLDALPVDQQLRLVSSADLLVGVHGAALAHALFLPARSALLELVPQRLGLGLHHFKAIARWRRLVYDRWISEDPDDDSPSNGYTTFVPPDQIDKPVKRIVRRLCSEHSSIIPR